MTVVEGKTIEELMNNIKTFKEQGKITKVLSEVKTRSHHSRKTKEMIVDHYYVEVEE